MLFLKSKTSNEASNTDIFYQTASQRPSQKTYSISMPRASLVERWKIIFGYFGHFGNNVDEKMFSQKKVVTYRSRFFVRVGAIIYHNDELSLSLSWIDCLKIRFRGFYLICRNYPNLYQKVFFPILLTLMYQVALSFFCFADKNIKLGDHFFLNEFFFKLGFLN